MPPPRYEVRPDARPTVGVGCPATDAGVATGGSGFPAASAIDALPLLKRPWRERGFAGSAYVAYRVSDAICLAIFDWAN